MATPYAPANQPFDDRSRSDRVAANLQGALAELGPAPTPQQWASLRPAIEAAVKALRYTAPDQSFQPAGTPSARTPATPAYPSREATAFPPLPQAPTDQAYPQTGRTYPEDTRPGTRH